MNIPEWSLRRSHDRTREFGEYFEGAIYGVSVCLIGQKEIHWAQIGNMDQFKLPQNAWSHKFYNQNYVFGICALQLHDRCVFTEKKERKFYSVLFLFFNEQSIVFVNDQ